MYSTMHCRVCQDKKRFDRKVYDAEKILLALKSLSRLIPQDFQLSDKDKYEARRIHYKTYPRFMCGHCPRANTSSLHQTEENILMEAIRLYAYARQNETEERVRGKIKYECQRLLSGFYPNIARLFHYRL